MQAAHAPLAVEQVIVSIYALDVTAIRTVIRLLLEELSLVLITLVMIGCISNSALNLVRSTAGFMNLIKRLMMLHGLG